MIKDELRKKIDEAGYTNSIFYDAPSFDNSIIGVDDNGKNVYAFELMIEEYVDDELSLNNKKQEDVSEDKLYEMREEAIEFIEFNTIRATPYMSSYGVPPLIIDYNPETEGYVDLISGDEFNLDTINHKIDDAYIKYLEYEE